MPNYQAARTALRVSTPELFRGLVSYWKLDEASGTRNDSFGTNHLTDENTVTRGDGKLGKAAQFTRANSERLTIADNASLSAGDVDLTLVCAVNWTSLGGGYNGLMVKWNGTGDEYCLYYDAGVGRITFGVDGGGGLVSVAANALGAPTTGVWYFVVAWHDSVANTLNIQVNNGAINSAAHSAGIQDSNGTFRLGEITGNYLDGLMDLAIVWKGRLLNAAERSYLFNANLYREFPWR